MVARQPGCSSDASARCASCRAQPPDVCDRMRPFVRLPFETIPDRPRLPHAYDRARVETLAMRSEPFGDVRIHLRRWGEGPPLLLIHGLMTSSYSWRYLAEPLAAALGRTLIAPDLPGAGRSSQPTDRAYTGPAYARWIGELVDALGIRGAPALGNSLGGYLCMRAALADPGLFSRLVNLHSPGLPEPRLHALRAALQIPGMRRGLAWWMRRDPHRWAHAHVHYFDESLKSREEAREYGDPLSTPDGSRAFARILGEVLAPADLGDFVRALEARRAAQQPFPIPLLLLYARQDPMVPPSMGTRLSALVPSAPLVWLDDTSHFAHVDTPEKVLAAVVPFFSAQA